MSVFENLIEELKEENLIEQTVQLEQTNVASKMVPEAELAKPADAAVALSADTTAHSEAAALPVGEKPSSSDETADVVLPFDENDFYRRRAMEEVSSLQMVERVFLGVEREQAKITPKPYDDIAVSKALHDFLQVSKNPNSSESATAEFKLMQETESWYSALSHRDQNLLVVHLRRYCETTKPVLSSQALVALARFYRNSPYSEAVRSKFDMIVTRLFTQEKGRDERQLVFDYDELVQHLSELYADWSSIPLYATDDDTELSNIALKFEDFITEAINASEFEQLVQSDFFNRLRAFKESTGENFYAPIVTAKAIKCNVRIGNRYVELLNDEKRRNNAAKLEDKYNYLLDQTISEATSKTLQLVQLLKEKSVEIEEIPEPLPPAPVKVEVQKALEPEKKASVGVNDESYLKRSLRGVNKWLVGLTLITILGTFGLYSWVELTNPRASTAEAQSFDLEGYYFKEYLKVAKITNETLIGIATPAWNGLAEEKREEILKNFLLIGKEKGFTTVHLISNEGKTVGYISAQNITQSDNNQAPKDTNL